MSVMGGVVSLTDRKPFFPFLGLLSFYSSRQVRRSVKADDTQPDSYMATPDAPIRGRSDGEAGPPWDRLRKRDTLSKR